MPEPVSSRRLSPERLAEIERGLKWEPFRPVWADATVADLLHDLRVVQEALRNSYPKTPVVTTTAAIIAPAVRLPAQGHRNEPRPPTTRPRRPHSTHVRHRPHRQPRHPAQAAWEEAACRVRAAEEAAAALEPLDDLLRDGGAGDAAAEDQQELVERVGVGAVDPHRDEPGQREHEREHQRSGDDVVLHFSSLT